MSQITKYDQQGKLDCLLALKKADMYFKIAKKGINIK